MTDHPDEFIYGCTGDVVVSDVIRFTEAVFGGSYRSPRYLGDRVIEALVVRDSYGAGKQQHTFTLSVLASSGIDPIAPGTVTRRKGRNVYKNGTSRKPWIDETARAAIQAEKHARGDAARAERDRRIAERENWI